MIPFQQSLCPAVESRYMRLAGPFQDHEESLMRRILAHLAATKARVVTVGEPDGVCIWRLASECETLEQTEARLSRLHS